MSKHDEIQKLIYVTREEMLWILGGVVAFVAAISIALLVNYLFAVPPTP